MELINEKEITISNEDVFNKWLKHQIIGGDNEESLKKVLSSLIKVERYEFVKDSIYKVFNLNKADSSILQQRLIQFLLPILDDNVIYKQWIQNDKETRLTFKLEL